MAGRSTDETLRAHLGDIPGVAQALHQNHTTAWAAVDPRLLELCRIRIAMLLRDDDAAAERTAAAVDAGLDEATVSALAQWPAADCFDATDRAALDFTERFVIDVATLPDSVAIALRDRLGAEAYASFVNALLVVEQRQRLALAWKKVL